MKNCSIDLCDKKHHGHGFCYSHLRRLNLYGYPLGTHDRHKPAGERFKAKFSIDSNGCHIWMAAKNADGYGVFGGKHERLAHRWAYAHKHGPIPDGMEVDHLCRTRNCVNPEHLELVKPQENTKRGIISRGIYITCPAGHERTKGNTAYSKANGSIICKTCRAIAARQRRKEAGLA